MFRGKYEHVLDSKGRLALPAKYREIIAATGSNDLFLTGLGEDHLRLYPLGEWERLERRLAEQPHTEENVEQFLLLASYYGHETALDRSGRVLIPQSLRVDMGLGKEVTLVGSNGHIKIWDRALLAARIARIRERLPEMRRSLTALGV